MSKLNKKLEKDKEYNEKYMRRSQAVGPTKTLGGTIRAMLDRTIGVEVLAGFTAKGPPSPTN